MLNQITSVVRSARLQDTLTHATTLNDAVTLIADAASAQGHHFSESELRLALTLVASRPGRNLSEEDLLTVAGGMAAGLNSGSWTGCCITIQN